MAKAGARCEMDVLEGRAVNCGPYIQDMRVVPRLSLQPLPLCSLTSSLLRQLV